MHNSTEVWKLPEHLRGEPIDFKRTLTESEARCQDCTHLCELDGKWFCNSVNDIVENIIDCPYDCDGWVTNET